MTKIKLFSIVSAKIMSYNIQVQETLIILVLFKINVIFSVLNHYNLDWLNEYFEK